MDSGRGRSLPLHTQRCRDIVPKPQRASNQGLQVGRPGIGSPNWPPLRHTRCSIETPPSLFHTRSESVFSEAALRWEHLLQQFTAVGAIAPTGSADKDKGIEWEGHAVADQNQLLCMELIRQVQAQAAKACFVSLRLGVFAREQVQAGDEKYHTRTKRVTNFYVAYSSLLLP